ncbi:MAG: hypothetical protein DI628_02595 [Blastochloris viridis]|uniref:Uncharacterized protein n=1 Tax=Blastochloris viridis TaxID=1079 RepID=A0A6N4R4J7_BLAVI|nr:MAG: hypothetical protein DI628_02595 [Blastochloris viridis]
MTKTSHLEAFAKCFDVPPEDDLLVVRQEVRVSISVHYPSQTASLNVHVGMQPPRTFTLAVQSADELELTWGENIVHGRRLMILAERLEDSAIALEDDTRALVRLLRQVDGDPNYRGSFVLA